MADIPKLRVAAIAPLSLQRERNGSLREHGTNIMNLLSEA